MAAYQGSWATIFARLAAEQAREDAEPNTMLAAIFDTEASLQQTAEALRAKFNGE